MSVLVLHFNPSRLTVESASNVWFVWACSCSFELFDAQEWRLNLASLIMALDSL